MMVSCSRRQQITQEEYNAKFGIAKPPTGRWQPARNYIEEPGYAEAIRATKEYVDAQRREKSCVVDTEYSVKRLDSGYLVFLNDIIGYASNGYPMTIPDGGLKVIIGTNMTVREVRGQP